MWFCVSVAQCESLIPPEKGSMNCSHPLGEFAYSTVCVFNCTEGWLLNGSNVLQCSASGNWTASRPTCEGILFVFLPVTRGAEEALPCN